LLRLKRDSSTTQLVKALAESRRGGRLRQLPSTEDQLRKIALELFFEKGFDEVTVKEIADRAGVTQRTRA
jgi:AcrR family transcriptional regulator